LQKLFNLLQHYGILTVVPMSECYFLVKNLPKKTKLSKELIKLNFEKYAPFTAKKVLRYQVNAEQLYLWFVKKEYRQFILMPESYLISLALPPQERIYIFQGEINKVFVIAKGVMQEAFELADDDTVQLSLLQDQYAIQSVVKKSAVEYEQFLKKGIEKLTPQALLSFWQLEFSKDKILSYILEKLTYPILFFIAFFILVSYTQSYFMQKKQTTLEETLHSLKSQNKVVKNQIYNYNNKVRMLQNFTDKELRQPDAFGIINLLYDVIKPEDKAKLVYFSFDDSGVQIRIETKEDGIRYLNRLNKIDIFKSVVIQSSRTNRRTKEKIFTFAIELKGYNGK